MQQEYYQEQAVAYAVMPEDVAHAFAFDSMAGYARGLKCEHSTLWH